VPPEAFAERPWRGNRSYPARMSTSPLSPQEIRAAAEVHRELGPEYSDAVVASFLEKVDREVAARVEARLAGMLQVPQAPQAQAAPSDSRALLKGIAIGAVVSGSTIMAAMSGNGSEGPRRFLAVLILWLLVALGYGVHAARSRQQPPSRRTAAER